MPTLGELLVADGICTDQQIEDAARNQVILGGLLGTNLIEMGFVDEATLAHFLSKQHDLPTLYGDEIQPDSDALGLIPPEAVNRLGVIPFIKETKRLQVLCVNPRDLNALDEVAFVTGLRPDPIVVPEVRFWELLKRLYGIDRQLRFVALNTMDFVAGSFAAEPAPPQEPTLKEDLISENGFDELYQRRDGFPQASPPEEPLPSEEMPLLSLEDLEEIEESANAQPPGGIDRRSWLGLSPVPGRRADDQQVADNVGAPPSQPPAPVADADPITFEDAGKMLAEARDRHEIARVVLRLARSSFERCMLFTVHRGLALGWDALGEGLDAFSFRSMMIPLNSPSIFQTVVNSRAHYLGALTKSRVNIQFLRATGKRVPLSAVGIPVLVRGRVVNVLYADNGHKAHSTSDIGELLIVAQRISQSYEDLFERKRQDYLKRRQRGDEE